MGTKQTAKEIEVDDKMVVAAAGDINTVLAPKPLLDLEKPGEELQKEIEELFPNIVKGDKLTKATWTTLIALGWKAVPAPKVEKPKVPAVAKTPAVAKAPKVAKPVVPAKPHYSRHQSVIEVLGAVEKGTAIAEQAIADKSDALYVKTAGKEANVKQALDIVKSSVLPVLLAMGKVKKAGDQITIVKSL
jgi:hypothetical protein